MNYKFYEVGSYFSIGDIEIMKFEQIKSWLPQTGDFSYVFSGRSAIEYAIEDILHQKKVKNVYMPSYCCTSMIQPFLSKGIDVQYYNVVYDFNKGIVYEIDTSIECDIFFIMSYFGLEEPKFDFIINEFLSRGTIIIEDITHRLLCNTNYSPNVDYSVASIRKWIPIPSGGYIVKHNGLLYNKPTINSDHLVLSKIEAMKEKYLFLQGEKICKNSYIEKFKKFEENLNEVNLDYNIDSFSFNIIRHVDIEKIKIRRRKNGKILYDGIQGLDYIKPLIPNPDFENCCPLFIPVMVKENKRDSLQKFLINHNVYCPVHWPNNIGLNNKIQENELSLVCDQRYSENDMNYVLNLIMQWHKETK